MSIAFISCSSEPVNKTYSTLPYSQLEYIDYSLPYIKYYGADSNLLVYGSNHTADFADPQIVDIEHRILQHQPTVILYEGDGIGTEVSKETTVSTYFEMGLVKYIADSLHIPSVNIEPETSGKYEFLSTNFTTDEIILATLGLQITMMQIEGIDFEQSYPQMIADLKKEGLELADSQMTIDYFYKIYREYMKTDFSYASFDSRDIQAKYNRTRLNKVNQQANMYRDQHILRLVDSLYREGERIYLQIGGWHAIVCEPGFKEISNSDN